MLFSDEAYFIFSTIPGVEVLGMTYWHIIYSPFILDNYIHTKYLLTFLVGSSAYLMGYGAASYLKFSLSPVLIGIWCVITQFALLSPVGYTPNYSTINPFIFNCLIASISFFLLYNKNIFLFLLGFFFGSLTFVMITNNIFVIPLLLFLFLYDKKGFWKNILWIGLGGLTLFSIYFIFFQSPQEFITGILKAMDALKHDKSHGSSGLKIWHYKLLKEILIPITIIGIASTRLCRLSWARYTLLVVSSLFLIYTMYNGITNKHSIFPSLSFYFLAGFILIFNINNSKITVKTFFAILLLVLPYFASFGTDVSFFIRSVVYFPFILVGSLYLGFQLNSKKGEVLTIGFISTVSVAILTFYSYPFRPTWEGYKLIEQDQAFEIKGSTLYLDKERFDNLNELYPHLKGEENVLVSYQRLWGYVLNSRAKPPYKHYKFNEYTIFYINENNIAKEDLLLLEDKKRPFDKVLIDELVVPGFKLNKTQLTNFNIYRIEKILEE
jgi:hypothetical protein